MNPFQSMLYQGISAGSVVPLSVSVSTDLVDGTSTNTINFSTTGLAEGDTAIFVYRIDGVTPTSASITSHSGVSVTLRNRSNGFGDSIGILSFKVTSGLLSGGGTRDLVLNVTGGLYAHRFIVTGGGSPTFTAGTLQGITNGSPLSVTSSGVSGKQFLVGIWNGTTTTANTPTTVTNNMTYATFANANTGTQVGVYADLCMFNGTISGSLSSDTGTGQMIAAAWFTI